MHLAQSRTEKIHAFIPGLTINMLNVTITRAQCIGTISLLFYHLLCENF